VCLACPKGKASYGGKLRHREDHRLDDAKHNPGDFQARPMLQEATAKGKAKQDPLEVRNFLK